MAARRNQRNERHQSASASAAKAARHGIFSAKASFILVQHGNMWRKQHQQVYNGISGVA